MSFNKSITLNNGVKMVCLSFCSSSTRRSCRYQPQIGLGTWQSNPGEVERAVETALKAGYKHIDAAVMYGATPAFCLLFLTTSPATKIRMRYVFSY